MFRFESAEMAEAKEDDLEPSGSPARKNRRSASVSGDFASNFPSVQANFSSSSRCQCSRCSDSQVYNDDGDLSPDSSVRRLSFQSDIPSFSGGSQRCNDGSFNEDGKPTGFEGDGEERENGYPLVADLSSMNFRRTSNDFSGSDAVSLSAQKLEGGLVVENAQNELKEVSEDVATSSSSFQDRVKDLLREASEEVDEQERQLLDAVESAMGSFHSEEGPSGLNHTTPRNGRISRHTCSECRQERRVAERSFASVSAKKIPTLNRVPTLTYDIPMSPVNPLRAMSGNKEYFANRSPQKLSIERASFCRRPYSPPSETKLLKKQRESTSSWSPPSEIQSPSTQHCSGWQSTKTTLKDRISFMCCNELLADVYFLVGRGEARKRFPVHKFVLVTGSTVFDAMFNGELTKTAQGTKTNELGKQEIELPDVEPSAFIALLRFLYSDDVCIGPDNVMTTLYTAKKYAISALEKACVDFLKRNLSSENAFMLLTQALLFDEHNLTEMCLEMIDKNTLEALSAEGFLEIDLETLCMVLSRETLRVREAPLFLAILKWSSEQCKKKNLPVTAENQRQMLGKALYLIRFPLMTVDEFAMHVAQAGILTDREVVNVFVYFTVNPKPEIPFPTTPRCCIFGKEVVVNRFQRVEARWGYSGTPDRIKFTVDKRIFVLGFGLHGSIHGPHEYEVTIQILHCGTGKVLASNDTFFTCDGSNSTFRVMFKEPVEILPCVTYIASARLKGPDSHYGTKGLRRIVHQSPSSGVVTFQFTYAAGNNNGTSVEDGQIPEIIFCTKVN